MKTIKACAKTIMFGEHAVVYGKPGIAVPITKLYTLATVVDEPFSYETDKELNEEETVKMGKLFKLIFEQLNIKKNLSAHIESNIPVGTGLGSSASLSVALIRAYSNYLDLKLTDERINEVAFECEKIFHGNPSGIDNTVITYEKPLYFKKGKTEFIKLKKPFFIIIASTGKRPSTKEMVAEVKKNYESETEKYDKIFHEIEKITDEARKAMERGDIKKIGKLMTNNHELLKKINVSTTQLDSLVKRAISAGAYGAKLAGAGGGGNIIALVDDRMKEKVFYALKEISHETISAVIA